MKLLIFIVIVILCGLVLFGCRPAQPKPAYGEKIIYAAGQPLEFPDFAVEFVGQRKESSAKFPPGFTFFDFRVSRDNNVQTVSWSSGTGDIGPALFEVAGQQYRLELTHSDKLGWLEDNELVIQPEE